jgi:hypothetical protein
LAHSFGLKAGAPIVDHSPSTVRSETDARNTKSDGRPEGGHPESSVLDRSLIDRFLVFVGAAGFSITPSVAADLWAIT